MLALLLVILYNLGFSWVSFCPLHLNFHKLCCIVVDSVAYHNISVEAVAITGSLAVGKEHFLQIVSSDQIIHIQFLKSFKRTSYILHKNYYYPYYNISLHRNVQITNIV